MSKKIAQVVFGLPIEGPFDYSVDSNFQESIAIGSRVFVSFNRRNAVGYVVDFRDKSPFARLNPVIDVLDKSPVLSQADLVFARSFSSFYGCSLGEALETILPAVLRKKNRVDFVFPENLPNIAAAEGKVTLAHSLNRKECFNFLSEQIKAVLENKQNVLVLLPEKILIKSYSKEISKVFDAPVYCWGSPFTSKKDLDIWLEIKSGKYPIIIGSRSSIFAPLRNLGLIVVEDEGNPAYFQDQTPNYNPREVALLRQENEKCNVTFVSSSPSAETWYKKEKYDWEYKYFPAENQAQVQLVDLSNYNPGKMSYLSYPLQSQIKKVLDEHKKIILFFNRRGFSSLTQCDKCGFKIKCERCSVNLTFIYSKKKMFCRRCGFSCDLPKICPKCEGAYLKSSIAGIEKLESEVTRLYPQAKIFCYDKENKALPEEANVIIATQAILEIKDGMKADIVAVLNFDAEVNKTDFRSGQKAFSLLVDLNLMAKEKLIVQTRLMDNYCIKYLKKLDFKAFYKTELKLRKELQLPPYNVMVAINIRGTDEEKIAGLSQELHDYLEQNIKKGVEVLDSKADEVSKLRDQYRYNVVLRSKNQETLLSFIKSSLKKFKKKSRAIITLDTNP